jgi:two-component system alkaline phosphatase synthesis response regulator PhoP
MLTSLAHQLSKELAQELGADGYITKPINLAELREAVERFLGAS